MRLAGAGVVTDPATGNVMAAEQQVVLSLFLKAEQVAYRQLPGVDLTDTVYEGYVVDPQVLPAGVVLGTRGTLVFAGQPAVECEVLEARLPYGSTGVIGGALQGVLGDRVRLAARAQG
jgi:hypothetical protein